MSDAKAAATLPNGGVNLGFAPPAASQQASRSDQAYVAIESLIATLKFKPGEVLTEQGLSAMLGLGRTPVREALKRLEIEGLVTIEPRRGAVVTQLDVKRQLQMLEVRRYVERYVAAAAAKRSSAEERREFGVMAQKMREAVDCDDAAGFLQLDDDFNHMLLKASRNEFAGTIMLPFQALSRRFWFAHYRNAKNYRETCLLHAEIAAAVAEGDAALAERNTDLLLDNVESFTRASLETDLGL